MPLMRARIVKPISQQATKFRDPSDFSSHGDLVFELSVLFLPGASGSSIPFAAGCATGHKNGTKSIGTRERVRLGRRSSN